MARPSGRQIAQMAQRQRQAEQRRAHVRGVWPKALAAFRRRVGDLVAAIGGPRELGRQSGVPHNTISGWVDRDGGHPSLQGLWSVAYATGRSADWLLGFDVPEMRREGSLESPDALRQAVIRDLAIELSLGPTFVSAALPADEKDLQSRLVQHYAPIVQALAYRKRTADALEELRKLPRRAVGTVTIGREIGKLLQQKQAEDAAEERRAMARLPSPDE